MKKADMEAKLEELKLEIRNFQMFLESDKFTGMDTVKVRCDACAAVVEREWRKDWIAVADVQRWLIAIQSIIG